ncbi:hypothetical protein Tco_0708024 [Tanacetum coccineum]
MKELWQIIDHEKLWCALDDEDAVRVSLLFVLEILFMGREEFLNVPLHILTLAEDFFTLNLVKNHAEKKDPNKMTTYNLNGFVWALKDSILNLVLPPTSGDMKADWLVRKQYYFNGEDAPFNQFVKPKCSDFQRCDSKDCTLVEQAKKPTCSTFVQLDAVKNQDVHLVQETQDVLGNVGSSYKGILEPKIMDTVEFLCKQLIDVRPEMNGMVDQLKSKVIDTLTTTFESTCAHAEVVEAEVVNCKTNLVECLIVEKDVGVSHTAVRYTAFNNGTLVNACAFVSHPLPFYDNLKADKFVESAQVTNDIDGYMEIENDPSKYCLDHLTIGIEEDTQNGELTVSLYEEQIANDNSDFDVKVTNDQDHKPTTPQVKKKKRKRFNNLKPIDFLLSLSTELDGSQETLHPLKRSFEDTVKATLTTLQSRRV